MTSLLPPLFDLPKYVYLCISTLVLTAKKMNEFIIPLLTIQPLVENCFQYNKTTLKMDVTHFLSVGR